MLKFQAVVNKQQTGLMIIVLYWSSVSLHVYFYYVQVHLHVHVNRIYSLASAVFRLDDNRLRQLLIAKSLTVAETL